MLCIFVGFLGAVISCNPVVQDCEVSSDIASASTESSSFVVCMQRQAFSIPGGIFDALTRAIGQASIYLPLFMPSKEVILPSLYEVSIFFERCKNEFVRGGAEKAAYESATSFKGIPASVLTEAADNLINKFGGSLPEMVLDAQSSQMDSRFNETRCRQVFSEDPEFDTLLALATLGASVPIQEDFVLQYTPEPLRKLHLRLGNCIPQHAFKLWESGKALLFRVADLPSQLLLHFNNSHWTSKPDTDDGRYLFDCANIANGSSINSEYAFQLAEEVYLPLSHPTILSILRGAVELANSLACPLSDLRLWKDDIKGAFGQFNFNPMSCFLLATQVAAGVVMIYIAGCFGYHACPLIFGVFSRAISRVLASLCSGVVYVYVDDLIGFSHKALAVADQYAAQHLIINIFGPKSLAEKSLAPCLVGEVLGWTVDLEKEVIRPNDKAIRKMMFAFFMVDLNATHWPLQQCQMLASLAERYSLALCGMKNFVQALHNLSCHPKDEKKTFSYLKRRRMRVTSAARFAVEMWRMVSVCLFIDPLYFSVSIRALVRNKSLADLFFISDAGPDKAGFAVYSATGCLLFYSAYSWPFMRNDNYQNAKEFLAFLLTLTSAVLRLGIRDCCIHWTGDNSAALSWVKDEKCRSAFAQLAFTIFSFLCLRRNIYVQDVVHRPGYLMGDIDALSRSMPHGLDPLKGVSFEGVEAFVELALLSDPILLMEKRVEDHHIALQKAFTVIDRLL